MDTVGLLCLLVVLLFRICSLSQPFLMLILTQLIHSAQLNIFVNSRPNIYNKAVSDGVVSNIRSLIHLVILQSLYRHTHRHTEPIKGSKFHHSTSHSPFPHPPVRRAWFSAERAKLQSTPMHCGPRLEGPLSDSVSMVGGWVA